MTPDGLWLWLAASVALVLSVLAAGLRVGLWWAALQRRRQVERRVRGAQLKELEATSLLTRLGYEVLAEQAVVDWVIEADDQPLRIRLRADYIITRNGKVFVADAKFGDVATSLRSGATRRQLLEYRLAYDVDGVVLLDMTRERAVRVSFPALAA